MTVLLLCLMDLTSLSFAQDLYEASEIDEKMPLNTITVDIEWEKNFTKFVGAQVAALMAYSINLKWSIFNGIGIALEENHTEGFLRIGSEYTIFINDLFFIAPRAFIVVTKENVSPSIILVIGVNW